MKHHMLTRFLPLALLATLAGCGDPKEANDSNFTKAINEVLKVDNPLCYIVSTKGFPLAQRKDGQFSYGAKLEQLHALVKAGVLTAKDSTTKKTYEGLAGNENVSVAAVEFSLTPTGTSSYKEQLPPNEQWPQGGAGFCLGSAEVAEIVEFSEPQLQQGGTVSTVKYIYKVKTAEPWAKHSDIAKTFPQFPKAEAEGLPAEIKLERGVKGWRRSRF